MGVLLRNRGWPCGINRLRRLRFQRADPPWAASAAPAGKARKKGADPVAENLEKQRQPADPRLRHGRGRIMQPRIEVLSERLADAAYEIAHQSRAADLGQGAGERVADDDV